MIGNSTHDCKSPHKHKLLTQLKEKMSLQQERSAASASNGVEAKTSEMSYLDSKVRIRICDLQEAKWRKEKWAMLTSYDTTTAKIFELAKIPVLLIGDSAAQAVLGYKSTIPVTVDELIPLARAVASSVERPLVIADLPFGSYQESPELALQTSIRFMKEAGAQAIKLEGGKEVVGQVRLLTKSGIPVMGHLGFTPQSEHTLGGFKIQARNEQAMQDLVENALALQEAGAFAVLLELMPSEAGKLVTERLRIPTVSIGAGPYCDAQILVWPDMAGFSAPKAKGAPTYTTSILGKDCGPTMELQRVPKFVKRYANLSQALYEAAVAYADDVRAGRFPAEEHCYKGT